MNTTGYRQTPLRLSRREFAAAIAVPLFASACSSPRFNPDAFQLPRQSSVGLFPAEHYDVDFADLVTRGFAALGIDLRNRRVFIKPNIVEYEPGTIINTHPNVIAGTVIACRRAGAREVTVGEGPGHRRDMEYLLAATGIGALLREERVPFVDLNHDDVRFRTLDSWFSGMRALALPVALLESDFIISMPKLKTHHWAGITCSMKNLFGTVPGAVYGWPKNILHAHGIDQSIVDLTSTIRPDLAIVDAVTAMEGDGPIMGSPRQLGFIGIGTDPVAVDATCARVIGLDPTKIDYIRMASGFLGHSDDARIEQRGESLQRYATQFEIVPALRHLRL